MLDEVAFAKFAEQSKLLMQAVWKHWESALSKSAGEMWQNLESLLKSAPAGFDKDNSEKLYESIRASPLFCNGSELLSLTIRDVYKSLKLKKLVLKYIVHPSVDMEAVKGLGKEAERAGARSVLTRVRDKPTNLHLKGTIAMVRGETITVIPFGEPGRLHMYKFERLSRGRPVIT